MVNWKPNLTKFSLFFALVIVVEMVIGGLPYVSYEISSFPLFGYLDYLLESIIVVLVTYSFCLGLAWLIGAFIPEIKNKAIVSLQKSVILLSVVMLIGVFISGFKGSLTLLLCIFNPTVLLNVIGLLTVSYLLMMYGKKVPKNIRMVLYVLLFFAAIYVITVLSNECVMLIGFY